MARARARRDKSIFDVVADALRKELEPQGYSIHVRTNHGEIHVTDVDANLTWKVGIISGPHIHNE